MGLLDEAIREHLELKRRRGADPSAIAHEEYEALAPVLADESPHEEYEALAPVPAEESRSDAQALEAAGGEGTHDEPVIADPAAASPVPAPQRSDKAHGSLADLGSSGQDTAELDMRAVMGADPSAADAAEPAGSSADGSAPPADGEHAHAEDPLKWRLRGEWDDSSVPEDVPGQERLWFE